jgi:hypothetical protein
MSLSKPDKVFQTQDLRAAAFMGLVLGLGTFWNGALIIAALLMLGTAVAWARPRVDLFTCCAIATLLALLQASFFIHGGPSVTPRVFIGFLAAAPTPRSITAYYLKLLGLFVPLIAVAFWRATASGRWLLVSMLVPIAFATTFKFTPDVSVNHKFVNASVRVAAIFVALILVRLVDAGRIARVAAVLLCVGVTATGAVDLVSLWNINNEKRTHNLGDPFLQWALSRTDPKAVFAAPPVYHHLVYFTGRRSYLGVPYWAASAGYDVAPRERNLRTIYEGGNPEEIRRLAATEGISFVIVDNVARTYYAHLDENPLRQNFPLVFSHGSTRVYSLRP